MDNARRMAALRALDANSKLWQGNSSPVPKGHSAAANNGNAACRKTRKPVRGSKTINGPLCGPNRNDHKSTRQTTRASTNVNARRDGDIDDSRSIADGASPARVRSRSGILKVNQKVSNTKAQTNPANSTGKWRSAFTKVQTFLALADTFGVDGLHDAAREWGANNRPIKPPKQVLLKLAETGEGGTRKHKLIRRKSAKALRQVFQGISVTDDGHITVHDFVRHVEASAPMLVDQATKMFDKLYNMAGKRRDSQRAERAVDFSKLLRCMWPSLSEDQVKDIASMAKAPPPVTKCSISRDIDTMKEIYDALNLSKSGFLSREEALKAIDSGRLVTEITDLNYLFGAPNTSYAKSHVHFEDFFAWWCSDIHEQIKDYINAQK